VTAKAVRCHITFYHRFTSRGKESASSQRVTQNRATGPPTPAFLALRLRILVSYFSLVYSRNFRLPLLLPTRGERGGWEGEGSEEGRKGKSGVG